MKSNIAQSFQKLLASFVETLEKKSTLANKAAWILETTGSQDAADLKAYLDTEVRILLSDPKLYEQLKEWEGKIEDPLLQREWDVLFRSVKQNLLPKELLQKISNKEAELGSSYTSFRPELNGKKVSENEIRDILKSEVNVSTRIQAWEASKQIGPILAPQILELVELRNQAARHLGYSDFFQMQLELQEVDRTWLLSTFETLSQKSDQAYSDVLREVEKGQRELFHVKEEELGPWSWSDPFCQEDPLDSHALDSLVEGVDIVETCTAFYDRMGMDVRAVLSRSDMFERANKNQHAFCIHIDRKGDVRTLNNVSSSLKWLETVLHEYGHAIYDEAIDPELPWILREPPHMITTEAMALLAGRQAYKASSLPFLVGTSPQKTALMKLSDKSLARRQLIFSRWVLVMTAFESELYRDPTQDLNQLWWGFVEKYQKIRPPSGREHASDWAAKYHIGLAPVYYFSYLLGEMFASAIQEVLVQECGSSQIATKAAGDFLRNRLFKPGNRLRWDALVEFVTGKPLTADAWLKEFCEKVR